MKLTAIVMMAQAAFLAVAGTTAVAVSQELGVAVEDRKTNYAVMTIKNGEGVSSGESEIIADRLRTEMFRTGRVTMMERDQMQEILKEQGFQASGACTDEACMVEIGQLLGVERLISGSIGKLGSMFLVNLRAIDVRTAKIIIVVSVDIKGGIEDVVEELPDIADQLAGKKESLRTVREAKKVEVKSEPEPEKEPEPEIKKEEPLPQEIDAPAPESVLKEEPKKEEEDEEKPLDKNANRGGTRLCLNIMSHTIRHEREYYRTTDYNRYTVKFSTDTLDPDGVDISAFLNPQIKFVIPAGRFVTIDIGPGIIMGTEKFLLAEELFRSYYWVFKYIIPDISTGVNFVWRLFPLKVNAGLTVDFLIPIVSKTDEITKAMADTSYSIYRPEMGAYFDVTPGGRFGVEILAGSKVGFGVEMIIRPVSFVVDFERRDDDGYETITEEKFTFKPIQFGFSVTLYKGS